MRFIISAVLLVSLIQWVPGAENWTRFRGPNGTGIADAPGLPTQWTNEEMAWKTPLPGTGHSSPVVYENQLYVATSDSEGLSRHLHALNTTTGDILWSRELALQTDEKHLKNSFASCTPAVSLLGVVIGFADDDHYVIAAFHHDGTLRWSKDLGPFDSQHGHGASPIIWEDLVIVPNDQDGKSSYFALSDETGEIRWETKRLTGDASYSTPCMLVVAGQSPQLIVTSKAEGVAGLDPRTGKTLWQSAPLPQRTVGSPILGKDVIYQSCGAGGRGALMIGVHPQAPTSEGSYAKPDVVFERSKQVPYVPTPIYFEGHLYLWGDNGVVLCIKPGEDNPLWMERLHGNFSASPVCINGCLYNANEEGEVFVIRAAPQYELLGTSSLDEGTEATPAIANNCIYFHTEKHVLCIAPNSSR